MVDPGDLRIGAEKIGSRNRHTGHGAGLQTLKAIWKNVISSPGSAREARTSLRRARRRAYYLRTRGCMKQANASRDRRSEVDDLQRTSGRYHRSERDAGNVPSSKHLLTISGATKPTGVCENIIFARLRTKRLTTANKEFAKIEDAVYGRNVRRLGQGLSRNHREDLRNQVQSKAN